MWAVLARGIRLEIAVVCVLGVVPRGCIGGVAVPMGSLDQHSHGPRQDPQEGHQARPAYPQWVAMPASRRHSRCRVVVSKCTQPIPCSPGPLLIADTAVTQAQHSQGAVSPVVYRTGHTKTAVDQ